MQRARLTQFSQITLEFNQFNNKNNSFVEGFFFEYFKSSKFIIFLNEKLFWWVFSLYTPLIQFPTFPVFYHLPWSVSLDPRFERS